MFYSDIYIMYTLRGLWLRFALFCTDGVPIDTTVAASCEIPIDTTVAASCEIPIDTTVAASCEIHT